MFANQKSKVKRLHPKTGYKWWDMFMKRALLVIDVQNEYFTGKLPVIHPENSFENIIKAMEFAKENGILITLIQHTNTGKDIVTF